MELALLVYGISLLKGVGGFLVMFSIVAALVFVGSAIGFIAQTFDGDYSWNYDSKGNLKDTVVNSRAFTKKALKYSTIVLIISQLFLIALPSEKTAWTMVGAYTAQRVAENPKVQAMSGKVVTIIEQKLDSYIDEGIAEAEKSVKSKVKEASK